MEKQEDKDRTESVLPIDEHEEFVSEGGRRVRRQGIYLLPNLLTLGALFSGFYAIIAGMGGDFNAAGWAVLIASVFDGLDGRVARLTGTQSAFGAEFDSLSDMVSFGMAPALIAFSWGLSSLGNPGWAAAFIFMSCAALRLARFNVQLGTVSKRFFVGLQSPVAAGLVTFCVWVAALYEVRVTPGIAYTLAGITVIAGLLMVSNYRYFSFKEMNLKGTVPYVVFLMFVAMLVLIAQNPHETLLGMCVLYALSGPVLWIYRRQGGGSGKGGAQTAGAVAIDGVSGPAGQAPDNSTLSAGKSSTGAGKGRASAKAISAGGNGEVGEDKSGAGREAGAEAAEPAVHNPAVHNKEESSANDPDKASTRSTSRNDKNLLHRQEGESDSTQRKVWQKYTASRRNRLVAKQDRKSSRLITPKWRAEVTAAGSASAKRPNRQMLQARRLTDRVKLKGKSKINS
ncbi:MAG: CDP-diacylglycerol--serine O-phosphatidyltransferase [Gammaproteobacteria bacterium]|jgi:CDP-diacylglycerol--serine O-phosphatidyltransferase